MMVAHEVPKVIIIQVAQRIDGELILETTCRDYDHYKSLPDVVAYEGTICGKTGWSSERNYACYKSSVKMARHIHDSSKSHSQS